MGKADFIEWIKADFRELSKADSTYAASQQTLFIVPGSPSTGMNREGSEEKNYCNKYMNYHFCFIKFFVRLLLLGQGFFGHFFVNSGRAVR